MVCCAVPWLPVWSYQFGFACLVLPALQLPRKYASFCPRCASCTLCIMYIVHHVPCIMAAAGRAFIARCAAVPCGAFLHAYKLKLYPLSQGISMANTSKKLKQVFLSAKIPANVAKNKRQTQEFIDNTMDTLDTLLNDVLDGTNLSSYEDTADGYHYALFQVDKPLTEAKARKLKAKFLKSVPDSDLLFSANFPCFGHGDDRPGALVMDMDMTTVQIEGIDEIARRLGVYDEVAAITEEAMRGQLEFSQSLKRRVALLKGGDANQILKDVADHMPETPGLQSLLEMCNDFKDSMPFKTCIASGGFHNLISKIDQKYGLSLVCANRLAVDADGKFTGELDGPIVDGNAKAECVKSLEKEGIPQERIIVIGDGANDILMMKEGGLGIAYHAKPEVQALILNALNSNDLKAVSKLLQMRVEFADIL